MRRTAPFLPILAALMVVALAGCGVSREDIQRDTDRTHYRISKGLGEANKPAPVVVSGRHVDISGHEVALESPAAPELRQRVQLASAVPATLREIARRLTQVTRLPVSVEPDVSEGGKMGPGGRSGSLSGLPGLPNLPLPGSLGSGGTGLPNLPAPPAADPGPASDSADPADPGAIRITYHHDGPLDEFLDQVASRLGIAWDYRSGRIVFSRFQTRTFTLHLPADVRTAEAEIGGKAMGQAQAAGAISSGGAGGSGGSGSGGQGQQADQSADGVDQKVKTQVTLDFWKDVEAALRRLASTEGHIAVAPSSGEVVVTDTPAAVRRIADYVEQKNASLTRQVAIQVDVLAVDDARGDNFEVDWQAVFQNADLGMALVSPVAMKGAATSLAMQVLRPTSDFRGTSVVIKAMSTLLNTRLVTSSVATTLNNHPAPIQVTRTDGYLRSVSSNVSSGVSNVITTSLVPGQITTGFIMTVTPRFLDHDRLLLTYNIDLSRLLPFTTASIGSGDTAASISIPNFERRAFMQAVAVKAGDTLVLSGFEQADDRTDLEGPLHPENSLFGSRQLARHRSRLIILMTPVIVGNGAA